MTTALKTGLGARLISSDIQTKPFTKLPIIDLANLSSTGYEDRAQLATEMQAAAIECGFFYIKNHGIPQETIDKVFSEGKKFFDQPMEKKMLVDMHKVSSFKGYLPLKGEKVDPDSKGDVHESFDIGTAFKPGEAENNQFPPAEDLPGFRPAIEAYWDAVMQLGKNMFPLWALALGLPETFFDDKLTNPGCVMRVLHYPPQNGPIDPKEIGIGMHSDYELQTILCQYPGVEALQVLNANNEWIGAPPIPGTLVVNLGDSLQRWTNGLFKSTIHRAINNSGQERMSIPFFFGADYNVNLKPLDTCISETNPEQYPPITAGEYIEQRLSETYNN